MGKTVLILGGGTGGVVAANVLRKTLGREHRVVLVDRKENHEFYSPIPFLLVNQRRPQQLTRKLSRLARKGIDFWQAEVRSVNPARSQVETDRGTINYDYLIISLGAEHRPENLPGFQEGAYNVYSLSGASRLSRRLQQFSGSRIVIFISSIPFVCPSATYEIAFLLDEYLRKKGLRHRTELSLITPERSPEPLAGPLVGARLRRDMARRYIKLTTEAKVLSLENGRLKLDQGEVEGDLFIGVPPHRGPSALGSSGLTGEGGWIEVDPHTLATRAENIFAVGDATAIRLPVMQTWAPKSGIFAHYQAEVAARNIALLLSGKKPHHRFTGKGL